MLLSATMLSSIIYDCILEHTMCLHHSCHVIFRDQPPSAEEDFPFVEQPSEDFFCPVIYGLLLQPHLTACCGKHLSQEAATRIQREGGACPLCNEPHLTTVLDKRFRRQVNELCVFCRHEDRGCGWQGELSDLERHVQSCPMKNTLKGWPTMCAHYIKCNLLIM